MRTLARSIAAFVLGCAMPVLSVFAASKPTVVDDAALSDETHGANWLGYGRTYSEQRYSPLTQIDTSSIKKLSLAWSMDLPKDHSLLSTPLVVDGVMYFTGSWSVTHAVDAATGKQLWEFDPKSIDASGDRLKIMWDSSRGLAYWKGKLVIATIDGRLIGLDAKKGTQLWSVQTTDPGKALYISGYPKVFRGKVIVGNGGTEFHAARGYVTAYDVDTGKLAWRFYVVPGNPADGFEDEAQAMAAKTWTGEWWKHGGGGNVWNGITYDPDYNQVLIGTGNGSPWNRKMRSPGGGDNLFLCAIVALDADTGKYKWHYQTVPGETWDYNSSMDIVLADLKLSGDTPTKVLMHAPKNGFFYVIDRKDGKLLSAEKFAKVTWATGIDMKTGRPIEAEGQRYENGESLVWPSPFGAHNWHVMSYSPKTGLVYIPKIEAPALFNDKTFKPVDWESPKFALDPAVGIGLEKDIPKDALGGSLLAWDPVKQRKVWEVPQKGGWNAGTLATGGGLVFQGKVDGHFIAYRADTGEAVWDQDLGLGISAPPVTYEVAGKQYVSLLVGFGGSAMSLGGGTANAVLGWAYGAQPRRLYTFAIDGKAKMPPLVPGVVPKPLPAPDFAVDDAKADHGADVYKLHCVWCHGSGAVSGGYAPDLRASPIPLSLDALEAVVVGGAKRPLGMPAFKDLPDADVEAVQHYIRRRANEDTATATTAVK